jgi:hypothetical protein
VTGDVDEGLGFLERGKRKSCRPAGLDVNWRQIVEGPMRCVRPGSRLCSTGGSPSCYDTLSRHENHTLSWTHVVSRWRLNLYARCSTLQMPKGWTILTTQMSKQHGTYFSEQLPYFRVLFKEYCISYPLWKASIACWEREESLAMDFGCGFCMGPLNHRYHHKGSRQRMW